MKEKNDNTIKEYKVTMVVYYYVMAENEFDAIEQAENHFFNDTHLVIDDEIIEEVS